MLTLPNVCSSTKHRSAAGLTLMELVVVMVILIALAGILLPLFPSMWTRAHTSTAATNMSELSKAVQTYQAAGQLPNYLDNLAPLVGQPNPANPTLVPSLIAVGAGTYSGGTAPTQDIWTASLATNDYNMLVAAGMTNVLQTMVPSSGSVGSWSPTYNPYSTTAIGSTGTTGFYPQNLTTGTPPGAAVPLSGLTVVYVNPTAAARELAQPLTGTYVLFGVGDYSSMSGNVLQQAPIHFDDSAAGEPNVAYCRFGLVFRTTGDGTYTDQSSARFVGTVDLGDATLSNIQDHIQGYLNTK